MYRGVYILYEILKWKAQQSINFTACAKDRGLTWKSNLQNYHIQLISPVQLLHDLRDISESPGRNWAEAVSWRGLAILIYRHAGVLGNCFTKLYNFRSVAWYPIGVCNARETSAEGKNHRKSLKIIGNDRKSSQMSGNDRSWSLKVGIGRVTLVTCDMITW